MEALPKAFNSRYQANRLAALLSVLHENKFFYVLHNNAGVYVVDYMGLIASDEQLIATYYKGEKQL
jgi:hypothetical protein